VDKEVKSLAGLHRSKEGDDQASGRDRRFEVTGEVARSNLQGSDVELT
jgi:hypothetical protein